MADSNVSTSVMTLLAIALSGVAIALSGVAIAVSIASNHKHYDAIEEIKAECAAKDSVAVKDIDGQYVCLPKK